MFLAHFPRPGLSLQIEQTQLQMVHKPIPWSKVHLLNIISQRPESHLGDIFTIPLSIHITLAHAQRRVIGYPGKEGILVHLNIIGIDLQSYRVVLILAIPHIGSALAMEIDPRLPE